MSATRTPPAPTDASGDNPDRLPNRWHLARSHAVACSAWLLPPLIWAAMALYYFSTFIHHPSRGVVGGPDGVLFAWFIESVEHSLANGHNPFISAGMNAPTGVSLMWNTSMFLPAVILAPLTAQVGGLAVAGWLMVAAPVLSATSAYFVLRRLTPTTIGSALVATLYGFGPFFVGQAGHLHLTLAAPFLPLFLLFGHRLMVRQTGSPIRIGIGLGVVVAAAMLTSEEVVAFGLVIAVVAVVAGVIADRGRARERMRFASVGVGAGAVTALVLLAVPLYYQFFGPLALHSGVVQGNQPLDLASLVRPSDLQYYNRAADVAANRRFPANGVENTGYLGLPLIVLVLAVLVWLIRRRDRFAYWWALTAAVCLVCSFGTRLWVDGVLTQIPLPWFAVKQLPLLHSVVTVRLSVITLLLIALLLAYVLGQLPDRRTYVAGLAVVALCLVPLRPVHGGPYAQISYITTPAFFTTSAVEQIRPGSTALILPQGDGPFVAQFSMYWQIQAKLRFNIIGGYGVFKKDGASTYDPELPGLVAALITVSNTGLQPDAGEIAYARASLPRSGIDYIVITPNVVKPTEVAQAAAAIAGCTPRPVADVILCEVPQS